MTMRWRKYSFRHLKEKKPIAMNIFWKQIFEKRPRFKLLIIHHKNDTI